MKYFPRVEAVWEWRTFLQSPFQSDTVLVQVDNNEEIIDSYYPIARHLNVKVRLLPTGIVLKSKKLLARAAEGIELWYSPLWGVISANALEEIVRQLYAFTSDDDDPRLLVEYLREFHDTVDVLKIRRRYAIRDLDDVTVEISSVLNPEQLFSVCIETVASGDEGQYLSQLQKIRDARNMLGLSSATPISYPDAIQYWRAGLRIF